MVLRYYRWNYQFIMVLPMKLPIRNGITMELQILVQILAEVFSISYYAHTLREAMNPSMGK